MTDVYSYELAAEQEAELRELHRPMRSFYLKPSNEPLQQRHGAFPMFWKDLAAWPGLRDVKKRYLAFQDGVEIPFDQATAPAEAAVVPGDEGEATASAVDEGGEGGEEQPRKRRSRWGAAPAGEEAAKDASEPSAAAAASDGAGGDAPPAAEANPDEKKKRKTRWGSEAPAGDAARKSRWAPASDATSAMPGALALTAATPNFAAAGSAAAMALSALQATGLGGAVIPKPLTQQEQQEVALMQMKVRGTTTLLRRAQRA